MGEWHIKTGRTECFRCSATEFLCDDCKDAVGYRVIEAARDWRQHWMGTGDVDNQWLGELSNATDCLLALDEYCKENYD